MCSNGIRDGGKYEENIEKMNSIFQSKGISAIKSFVFGKKYLVKVLRNNITSNPPSCI